MRRVVKTCAVATALAMASSALAFQPNAIALSAVSARSHHLSLRGPVVRHDAGGCRLRPPVPCPKRRTRLNSLSMVDDFKDLVEAAEPDATIVLKAGTYVIADKLLIDKDLYIEAEEGAMGKVIITDPEGSDPEDFFLEVRGCGVAFDGVQVVKSDGSAKGAGCVCVLDDGRATFFNQPPLQVVL